MLTDAGEERVARVDNLVGVLSRHPEWSDARLVAFCNVHRTTVRRIRGLLVSRGVIPAVRQVIRKDGTPYPYPQQGAR